MSDTLATILAILVLAVFAFFWTRKCPEDGIFASDLFRGFLNIVVSVLFFCSLLFARVIYKKFLYFGASEDVALGICLFLIITTLVLFKVFAKDIRKPGHGRKPRHEFGGNNNSSINTSPHKPAKQRVPCTACRAGADYEKYCYVCGNKRYVEY